MNRVEMKVLLLLLLFGAALVENVPFSSTLYYKIAKSKPNDNVIISPASIASALGLVYMGAENETAKELHNVLQLPGGSKDEVGQYFGEYIRRVNNSGVEMKTANRIYLANHYDIAPKYNELVSKYFEAQVQNVDFSKPETVRNINSWVEDQTNKKIKDLLQPESVKSSTEGVLINAIYFKANWRYIFKKKDTFEMDFHTSVDKKVPVKTMVQTLRINYDEFPELDATGVELPYENTNVHMLILLPDRLDGLAALEEKLKNVDLTNLKLKFSQRKMELFLPKFKVEFEISLVEALKNVGLKHFFSGGSFSLTTAGNPLQISEALHKAFIEVDEQGTEAAAATALKISKSISSTFNVNHPFFFAIRDNDTVYFAGHVLKPQI